MNRLYCILLLLLTGATLPGQDITVSVRIPGIVAVGEQFMITWVVNHVEDKFEPPQFTDFFHKLMGPQTSFSSSTQIINGKVSSETGIIFRHRRQQGKENSLLSRQIHR
ncbi:MAG: BatD family protein [Bacteroidales bacterium]